MRRFISLRGLIPLAMALSLVACSRVAIVYENADWLTYRWAVGLVDATDIQRDQWRPRFNGLLAVHRVELLPEVTRLLRQIEQNAERGLQQRTLSCLLENTDDLYRAHARLFVPLAVGILSELSPAQQAHLAERMAERNAEYVEDYLTDDLEERREARVERYLERIERWTGRLNRAQREMVAGKIAAMPDTAGPWLTYRHQQQQRLLALLRDGATKQRLTEFLITWWVDLADRPAELVTATDALRRRSIALTLDVDASLAEDQRAHFIDEVSDLRAGLSGALTAAAQQRATVVTLCS